MKIVLLTVIILSATIILLLRNPGVQSWMVKSLMEKATNTIPGRFYVDHVEIKFFNRLQLSKLYIEDIHGDTLLYVPELTANIKHINRRKNIIDIGKLVLKEPRFKLSTDSSLTINLSYFINELKKENKDSTGRSLELSIHKIEYINAYFSLKNNFRKNRHASIDFTDMELYNINMQASELHTIAGGISLNIKQLSFREKSGFVINEFKSKLLVQKKSLQFLNNRIKSSNSDITSEKVAFEFNNYKDFKNLYEKVKLYIIIKDSELDSRDLAYFVPGFSSIEEKAHISGSAYGRLSGFHGRNIRLDFDSNTSMAGKFDISGLPDIENAFFYINMQELNIGEYVFDAMERNNIVEDPEILRLAEQLGYIRFKGVFTGFIDDFVSYGSFKSHLGIAHTDISIVPDSSKAFSFKGKLDIADFNIGSYTKLEDYLGSIAMSVGVKGSWSPEAGLNSEIEGMIRQLEFNDYYYRNIELSGIYAHNSFDGNIGIDEANLKLDFLGLLDFSSDTPEFDFSLNIPHANLYKLQFIPSDSTADLSLLLTANFIGNTLDDFNGSIRLLNSRISSKNEVLEAYNFTLEAHNKPDSSRVYLETDYLDAELIGNYKFSLLKPSLSYLQTLFIPGSIKSFPDTTGIYQNNFTFNIHFRNTEKISDFFFPHIRIAPGSTIHGIFNPSGKQITMKGNSESLLFNDNELVNPGFMLSSEKVSEIDLGFKTDELILPHRKLVLTELRANSKLKNDSLNLNMFWSNDDSLQYHGNIDVLALFSANKESGALQTDIHISPGTIIHKGDNWQLNEATITTDSNSVRFRHLALTSHNKMLALNGIVSENPEGSLLITARGLDLSGVNLLNHKLKLKGIFQGNATVSDLYKEPRFISDFYFRELKVNNVGLGNVSFSSEWNHNNNSIMLEENTDIEGFSPLSVQGEYFPGNKTTELNIKLDSLDLNIFKPFVKAFSSRLQGDISGSLKLKGKIKQPVMSGKLSFRDAALLIDMINTSYNFNDDVDIYNSDFLVSDVTVYDSLGNTAHANGHISARNLKKLFIDLDFQTDEMLMLNLEKWQNKFFYGNVVGSGSVSLKGTTDNIKLDIAGKTMGNSRFFLPLDKEYSRRESHYLSFINTNESEKEEKELKKNIRNPKEIAKTSNVDLNINLETTPELEATLFFDPMAGGSLTSRGIGELKVSSGSSGDFNIFGEYTIDQGIYNFKLSHLINKKFEVKNGSRITFTGNPQNARLDVVAIYKVRTSLYNLYYDEAYRRRIPVNCEIYLSGKLESPVIRFNIDLPTADEDTKSRLKNTINTEEDLSKQFLSLLIINSFLPDPNYAPPGTSPIKTGAVEATTAELLSSQLSSWISQISNDFDIGFRYRPGDQVSSQEIELAIATQILNDRVLINSNIDVGGNQYTSTQDPNEIVGYVSVEVKVDKSGKLRLKAFTRPNDKMIYEESTNYETGIGIFFREEFDSFGELLKSYWDKLFKKKNNKEIPDKNTS